MKRRRLDISIAILVILWLAPHREAGADRGEASLHGHVQFGTARLGIREAPGQVARAPFRAVGARATYATSNWYAYEAAVWLGRLTSPVQYTVDTAAGAQIWHLRMDLASADLGITARLGVRLIPTLHAALGVQTQFVRQGRALTPTYGDKPHTDFVNGFGQGFELVGTLGAGLDYRLGEHWISGLAVSARRAVLGESPFQAIAATFHISYYFYPEGADQ